MKGLQILQALYHSRINASISWFGDGGFVIRLGDEWNGWVETAGFHNIEDGIAWLRDKAIEFYPTSEFARTINATDKRQRKIERRAAI